MKRIWILLIFASHSLFAGFYMGVEGGYSRSFGVFDIYQDNLIPLDLKKQEFRENGIMGNVVLGSEHFFFNNYLGIRWGVFGGYGKTWGKNETYGEVSTSVFMAGANADVIVNFVAKENFTSGIFIGIECNYADFKPDQKIQYGSHFSTSFPIYAPNKLFPIAVWKDEYDCFVNNDVSYWIPFLRIGTSFLFNKHHRIELFAKIPLVIDKQEDTFTFSYKSPLWKPSEQRYNTQISYTHSAIQAFVSYKIVF